MPALSSTPVLARSDPTRDCPFAQRVAIETLPFRETPYWWHIATSRHLGIYRPHAMVCTWTARYLTTDRLYRQKALGPALDTGKGVMAFGEALRRAQDWFAEPEVVRAANRSKPVGRTTSVNFCPLGEVYTVGHALADYTAWTRIARSPGGHYNNLALINYHLATDLLFVPVNALTTWHLRRLAHRVLERPPKFGFQRERPKVRLCDLTAEDLRRRKRTFNSLVTILRMAFRMAWENGYLDSERTWRCLHRMPVNHTPRRIFLDRNECRRLLAACPPALRDLVLAALYSGCRVGELAQLRVEDVAHQIYGLRVPAFKRSPGRFVFLPDEGMAFFLHCCEGKGPRDHVLLSAKGRVWRRQHAGPFRLSAARAGLPATFVFHGLRHTYASDLIRKGVPLEIVARQLGHADTRTVASTYGHLAEQYREDQIRSRFSLLDSNEVARANSMAGELAARRQLGHRKEQ
ncbi:tyrosine-type recombinase/integrase [Limimaricola pyoseonensis]|uniref:Site-specific recombinase XerD n=1 Tax=Limimaricola pyoseonensis TaxID=521013 RepID=A0A1G7II44_9RHOB|nr:tyrosine-type recombinase/integrase [Limimaricola pyoseonensis]SDF12216.1 Site-specific recombinase XerD [Limimaricola pyoseonensis]